MAQDDGLLTLEELYKRQSSFTAKALRVLPAWFDGANYQIASTAQPFPVDIVDATGDGMLVNLGSNNDVRISDGTDIASVLNLAVNDALAVALVNGSGVQVSSFTGTLLEEGDSATSALGEIVFGVERTANRAEAFAISPGQDGIQLVRPYDTDARLAAQGAQTASIGTSESTPIAANVFRIKVVVTNRSDNFIYLAIDEAATTNHPYVLVPLVGSRTIYNDGAIHAIADAASSTLAWEEYHAIA